MKRLERLSGALKSLQCQIRSMRSRERYRKRAWLTHPILQRSITKNDGDFIVRLYAVSGYNTHVASKWLSKRWFQGKAESNQLEHLRTWVEELFLEQGDAALFEMWNPTTPIGRRQLARAYKMVKENEVCHWLSEENVLKGVAPRTEVVMQQLVNGMEEPVTESAISGVRSDLTTNTNRMFAMRFRRRWGISMTRMRERAPIDVEGLRRKAAGKLTQRGHPKTGQGSPKKMPKIKFRGPIFGSTWRSPFCEDFFLWPQKRDRFLVPKNGTVFRHIVFDVFCVLEFLGWGPGWQGISLFRVPRGLRRQGFGFVAFEPLLLGELWPTRDNERRIFWSPHHSRQLRCTDGGII